MSKAPFEIVPQIVFTPKDPETCRHLWSWHTYAVGMQIVTKKMCFYCKKVEDA